MELLIYININGAINNKAPDLSFLPYTTGKQQLDEEMPQIRHFYFINRSQRDNLRETTRYTNAKEYALECLHSKGVFILRLRDDCRDRDEAKRNRGASLCTPKGHLFRGIFLPKTADIV